MASICAAAVIIVSMLVFASPSSASCTVRPTIAPVSRSTACPALWARCAPPVLHFGDFVSGSCGWVQSSFEPLLPSSASDQSREVSTRRGLDARGLRQLCQDVLIALARVAPHNAAQYRICLQRRRIDANGCALDQALGDSVVRKDRRVDRFNRFREKCLQRAIGHATTISHTP